MTKHLFLVIVTMLVAGFAEARQGSSSDFIQEGGDEVQIQLQYAGSSHAKTTMRSFDMNVGRLPRLQIELQEPGGPLNQCRDLLVLSVAREEMLPQVLRHLDLYRTLDAQQTQVLKSVETWHLIEVPGFDQWSIEEKKMYLKNVVENTAGVTVYQCFNSRETNRTSSSNRGR
jgi:hypothetical protein